MVLIFNPLLFLTLSLLLSPGALPDSSSATPLPFSAGYQGRTTTTTTTFLVPIPFSFLFLFDFHAMSYPWSLDPRLA
ncbi:hypothetical protein vseg_010720 [Gypsophila vaccaria]